MDAPRSEDDESTTAEPGAYGVRLFGVHGADTLLPRALPGWPTLEVVVRTSVGTAVRSTAQQVVGDATAHYRFVTGGGVVIDRATRRATFTFPSDALLPRPDDLVHPLLCAPLATIQSWEGRSVFHAGAFAVGGGAWAVMGTKGAGKSTLLATLALLGAQILTDDLVVIADDEVLAGPSCIDLRTDSAGALGVGRDIGVVGTRRRWRYVLGTPLRRVPLQGWILPQWGDTVSIIELPIRNRVTQLLGNVALRPRPPAPSDLLELASYPHHVFTRPRDWRSIMAASQHLLDHLR
jgi:hypothetical protein